LFTCRKETIPEPGWSLFLFNRILFMKQADKNMSDILQGKNDLPKDEKSIESGKEVGKMPIFKNW